MLMTLRILRGIVGFIAIWQIIGLLPVLTNWLPSGGTPTGGMWAIAFVKLVVLLVCSAVFYWLGRIKKRYEPADATTSELPVTHIGNTEPSFLRKAEATKPTTTQEKIGIILRADDGRTILNISDGSPAQQAGLAVGDQIFAVNEELCGIDGKANARKVVEAPGANVRLGVWRDGSARIFTVTRAEA